MPWFPAAIRDPGKNAGYRSGHASMQLAVDHFTVGRDSRALIRDKGLAQFLFPKQGQPFQFAEADAVCSHACEWNRLGPGLEFERLNWDEPLTAEQIHWGGEVTKWLSVTYGIPLVHHGGARLPIGDGFRGFVNHGSLVHRACDQHTDGITDADFAAMVGTPTTSDKKGHNDMLVYAVSGSGKHAGLKGKRWIVAPNGRHTEIDAKQYLKSASTGIGSYEGDAAQCAQLLGL